MPTIDAVRAPYGIQGGDDLGVTGSSLGRAEAGS
jgi:hypothetical protein